MPQYNRRKLDEQARQYGFQRDTFEKVLRLKNILEYINSQEYLKSHLLLKGGTAINLTFFNLPRLSVDIDLDFIPNLSRGETLTAREKLTVILKNYMQEQGYYLSEASRFSFSLDAFHYVYENAAGNRDMIKIEINYSLRSHVLPAEERILTTDAFGDQIAVATVAPMEIFAAKINALLSRAAARDLYDVCNMIENKIFSDKDAFFRKCIIFYATISSKKINMNFNTSSIDSIVFSKIKAELFPVLSEKRRFDLSGKKQTAKGYISDIMKLTDSEHAYMERFAAKEYRPDLLFADRAIIERIKSHPMALWKCSSR